MIGPAIDMQALAARKLAPDKRDGAPRQAERAGQPLQQFGIGASLDRRRRQTHPQGTVVHAGNGRAAGVGHDLDPQFAAGTGTVDRQAGQISVGRHRRQRAGGKKPGQAGLSSKAPIRG